MKRWIAGIVTAVALTVGAGTASAQGYGGYRHASPYHSHGYSSGYGGYNAYGSGYRGFSQSGYGGLQLHFGNGSRWHDTSHYDYHPGSFQRHRNHYHYVPGHYDFHRSGHHH